MNPIAIVIWVAIIAVCLLIFFGGRKNKKQYEGQSMEITKDWYENSQRMYSNDDTKKAYFFTFDKHYLTQGHYMVDQNHQTVYEEKVLYGDFIKGYEEDFTNYIINYKSHHKLGAVSNKSVGSGNIDVTVSSFFKFDGVNIWNYLESLGYDYHFERRGLAYWLDVTKNGTSVGTIYSSNGGKNYFGCEGHIEAKAGSKGYYIVECADKDIDGLFLLALALTKTELSADKYK